MGKDIPVTILSGILGAGKTTTLNHLLNQTETSDIAVLVNDMGAVNVDAADIKRQSTLSEGEVVELSNGCICCGVRGEFERAVIDLALEESFSALIIEPSGISEPETLIQTLIQGRAGSFYDLSSAVTVVDARRFYDAFVGMEQPDLGSEGDKSLSDLIASGIEFCDTVLLNKTDLITEEERKETTRILRSMQPEARVVETTYGAADPENILWTDRFDIRTVSTSAHWKQTIGAHRQDPDTPDDEGTLEHNHDHNHSRGEHEDHDHQHAHDGHLPEEYGVSSFVFESWKPFHPERLAAFFDNPPVTVIRVKGNAHIAGRPNYAINVSLAGVETHVEAAGRWIVSLPPGRQAAYRESRDPDWHSEYGDRKTELVVIGQEMNVKQIRNQLEDCVVGEGELTEEVDQRNNPFPKREDETVQFQAFTESGAD